MTRTCTDCTEDKPIEGFAWRRKDRNERHYHCKPCGVLRTKRWLAEGNNRERNAAKMREWHRENRGRKYGLKPGEYEALMTKQGGRCAICRREPETRRMLAVDHDHTTGRVRGLLCHSCNSALGLFGDSPERLMAAARYLNEITGGSNAGE